MIRARFPLQYTLAGVDLRLHRIRGSMQVPARRAAELDEARIAALREETGGWSHLGAARARPDGEGDLRPRTRVSLAALIAVKPGCRPWLLYRVHHSRGGNDRRALVVV